MLLNRAFTAVILGTFLAGPTWAAPALVEVGASTLAESAHASDGSDRARDGEARFTGPLGAPLTTYNGYQYSVYYTGKDRAKPKPQQSADVIVARRKLDGGAWERATLLGHKVTSDDAHNRADIAVSGGDGVIHLTFDHHNSTTLNYAHSALGAADHPEQVPWSSDAFAYRPNLALPTLNDVSVTYPSFESFPGGNIILYFRQGGSTDGAMRLTTYDSAAHRWGPLRYISTADGTFEGENTKRGPYLSGGMMVGPDGGLAVTWVFREKKSAASAPPKASAAFANHGLYFARSPDQGLSWYGNDGQRIADTRRGETVGIDNTPTVYDIPRELAPSNVSNAAALDPVTGAVHVLIEQLDKPDGKRRVAHYVGTPQGQWTRKFSDFTATGISLKFAGDHLFALAGRTDPKVWVAARANGFETWTPLPLLDADGKALALSGGFGTWDLARLGDGSLSLAWQEPPASGTVGDPSPIRVLDFQLRD